MRHAHGDALGLRRVGWVRVTVDRDTVSAAVVGLGHRTVRERPISLRTAAALAREGVRLVVHRHEPALATEAAG